MQRGVVIQVCLVDKAQCAVYPLVGTYCWSLLWSRQFDRKSKSRINVTSSLTDALFSPVLLLLFFPALDKRLHLWLIKHVVWSCVCALLHTCAYDCVHADENLYKGIHLWLHAWVAKLCVFKFCICTRISPLCFVFFSFDLPLVSSHYASTGVWMGHWFSNRVQIKI